MEWILITYLIGVVWGGYLLKFKYGMNIWWALFSWVIVAIHYCIDEDDNTPNFVP